MGGKKDRPGSRGSAAAWPALLMAWVAGGVDAIGYLTLSELFTAHMSGNTAAMSAHLGQGEWAEGLRRGFPIPLFMAGVAAGSSLDEIFRRRDPGKRRRAGLADLGSWPSAGRSAGVRRHRHEAQRGLTAAPRLDRPRILPISYGTNRLKPSGANVNREALAHSAA